jgi:hypothetical protein
VAEHNIGKVTRVTSREELHLDRLNDEDAKELLRLASSLYQDEDARPWPLPAFVGMGDSGRGDVSERADKILREGFGK